jgi:hypothetical protein
MTRTMADCDEQQPGFGANALYLVGLSFAQNAKT